MKTAIQELIEKIQYSIDVQSGVSLTETQVNTLKAVMLVAERLLEKEKKVIGIIRDKKLASKILQQTFKIGECEQLRNQLVLEKEVKFNAEIKKTKKYLY